MELSILALVGLWFWKQKQEIKTVLFNPLLSGLIIIGLTFSGYYLFSDNQATAYGQWERIIFSCLAFFVSYRILPNRYRNILLNILIVFGGLISMYGILQKTGGVGFLQVPKMDRVYGTFGNPNFFGSFLIGLIPITTAVSVKYKKTWSFIFTIIMLIALYFTKTRGAWLGLLGSGFIWWILWGRNKTGKKVSLGILIIICIFAYLTRGVWVRQTQRLLIWRDTLKMISENPVFGVGLGVFHSEFPSYASSELLKILPPGKFIVNYAHNEFLEIFSEVGIFGFGIYLWFLVVYFVSGFKAGKKNSITKGMVCGAAAVLIHSSVSVNMRFGVSSIWVFCIMGLTFGFISEKKEKGLPIDFKNILLAIAFFFLLGLWSRTVIEPLVSQKKLSKEVDFFDQTREYDIKDLEKIIEQDPGNAKAYYKLAWIYAKEKKFKKAIENFKKTISLDESLVGAYNNLGNIYYTMGKRQKAVKYYNQALKRNPNLVDAHFNLGYIYYYQGKLKQATKEFNTVLKLDPDNYKAKIMLDKMVQ